jgi:hypothetical protein
MEHLVAVRLELAELVGGFLRCLNLGDVVKALMVMKGCCQHIGPVPPARNYVVERSGARKTHKDTDNFVTVGDDP